MLDYVFIFNSQGLVLFSKSYFNTLPPRQVHQELNHFIFNVFITHKKTQQQVYDLQESEIAYDYSKNSEVVCLAKYSKKFKVQGVREFLNSLSEYF